MGNYKLEYTGKEIDKILDKANSNTPVYSLESEATEESVLRAELLPIFQKMYEDYKNGKQPLLILSTKVVQDRPVPFDGIFRFDYLDLTNKNFVFKAEEAFISMMEYDSYSAVTKHFGIIQGGIDENDQIYSIGLLYGSQGRASTTSLSTVTNYEVPYEPKYDGSPATKKYVDTSIAAIASAGGGSGKIVAGELPRNSSATSSVDLGADVKAVIVSCNRFLELEKTETIANVTQLIMTPILLPGQTEQYLWYQSGSTDDLRWQKATLSATGVLSIPAKCYGITYIAFY